jgi:hypothetical protein
MDVLLGQVGLEAYA